MAATAHGTLVADTVTTATIDIRRAGLEIVNRSETGEIWARFDGVNPVIGAADSYVIVGARSYVFSSSPVTVKLISNAALKYSVEAA